MATRVAAGAESSVAAASSMTTNSPSATAGNTLVWVISWVLSTGSSATPGTPSGWTKRYGPVSSANGTSGAAGVAVYSKTAAGGVESPSFASPDGSGNMYAKGMISEWSNMGAYDSASSSATLTNNTGGASTGDTVPNTGTLANANSTAFTALSMLSATGLVDAGFALSGGTWTTDFLDPNTQVSVGALAARKVVTSTTAIGATYTWNSDSSVLCYQAATVVFSDAGTGPAISSTGSANPVVNTSLTITGTNFGSSQGAGSVTIGGVTQTVTAWADTSITVTVVRGTNNLGVALNVVVTDNSLNASAPYALTSLQPQAGWVFVNLVTPNTVAANRLETFPPLSSGNQINYESKNGAVVVATDATFNVASGVTSFQFEAWDGAWGSLATQDIPPQWFAPASADSYELASRVAEFQALLNPQTWFGPIAVEKWFAPELAFTAGGPAEIIGTLNATLGAMTVSGAATVPHTASLSVGLGTVTLAANAVVPLNATLAVTLGVLTLSGAAAVAHTADLNATLGAVTVSGAGVVGGGISGALTVTLGTATVSGAGGIAISGNATPNLGALTLTAAATVPSAANLTQTLGALTVSAVATVPGAANLTQTLGLLTASATGSVGASGNTGNLNATLGTLALSASGVMPITGVLNPTLAALALSGAAKAAIAGVLDAQLGALTLFTGIIPPVFSGGNSRFGAALLAASNRIGNTILSGQKGRVGL